MTNETLDFAGFLDLTTESGLGQEELAGLYEELVKLKDMLVASDLLMHQVLLHAQKKPYQLPDDHRGEVEYGMILYWIQNPPKQLLAVLKDLHIPDWLWNAIKAIAPKPKVTEEQYAFLLEAIKGIGVVAPVGTILGESQYEQLDEKWLYAFGNYLLNLIDRGGIAAFGTDPCTLTIPAKKHNGNGKHKNKDEIRIMLIGDWGTGLYDEGGGYDPAKEIIDRVNTLNPDYLIHLGDVYYAGTDDRLPPGEEHDNFLKLWPANLAEEHSFTLNSNHEMYGGAQGYFNVALAAHTPFSHQNSTSYFSLKFGDWVIVGLDAAYHDPSILYMQGSLGDKEKYPHQYTFLKEATQDAEKIMLMTHQTAMDTPGKQTLQLWQDVKDIVIPDYWYWGHVHLGVVYNDQSILGKQGVKARCVGHSAIPFGKAWEFNDSNTIDWYANTPADIPNRDNLCKNGFAMLTLGSDGSIKEEFYETGKTNAVWTS